MFDKSEADAVREASDAGADTDLQGVTPIRRASTTRLRAGGFQPGADAWPEFVRLALQDLQNPIALLDASLVLLAEDFADANPETQETLRAVRQASRRIQRYIDHVVTAELVSSGRVHPRFELLDVSGLLRELVADFDRGARASSIDLSIEDRTTTGALLTGDETLLLRIFQSLLEHAVCRVVSDGRVLISVRTEDMVEVRVCNDGPMLSGSERQRIFDRLGCGFSGRRGAGPSLYFCRLAIEAHGGTITHEETAEWPSAFVVRLPLAPR